MTTTDSMSAKHVYRERKRALGLRLSRLQRLVFEHDVPVLIVFEGREASGKGDSIARLVEHMDPRGFTVSTTRLPHRDERLHPWMWRFWLSTPPRGSIGLFDQSWYFGAALVARDDGDLDLDTLASSIRDFEKKLVDDGVVLVKIGLEIDDREARKRLKEWKKDAHQRWRIFQESGESCSEQDDETIRKLRKRTSFDFAPWHVVDAGKRRARRIAVLEAVVGTLDAQLRERGIDTQLLSVEPDATPPTPHDDPLPAGIEMPADSPLDVGPPARPLDDDTYDDRLDELQQAVRELAFGEYVKRRGAVIVFEGWDAGGKGGAIRRLTRRMDPRGYRVVPVAAPTPAELDRHYLWRFWRDLPKLGHIGIFDRSWYGRVLVERVEGFAEESAWQRAYHEIQTFEERLLDAGMLLIKFWLQISPEEQLRRFRMREQTPVKRHKITDEDWRNRAKYGEYLMAVDDMIQRTSTERAPWTVVDAEQKRHARLTVLETVQQVLSS